MKSAIVILQWQFAVPASLQTTCGLGLAFPVPAAPLPPAPRLPGVQEMWEADSCFPIVSVVQMLLCSCRPQAGEAVQRPLEGGKGPVSLGGAGAKGSFSFRYQNLTFCPCLQTCPIQTLAETEISQVTQSIKQDCI